jgi:hypothetical protein
VWCLWKNETAFQQTSQTSLNFMLYNFTTRRVGVCVSSTLADYRKLVPASRPRQEFIATTRVGQTSADVDMATDEYETYYAEVKRRKY